MSPQRFHTSTCNEILWQVFGAHQETGSVSASTWSFSYTCVISGNSRAPGCSRLRNGRFHIHALLANAAKTAPGPLSASKSSRLYIRVISRSSRSGPRGCSRPRTDCFHTHASLAGGAETAPGRSRPRNNHCYIHALLTGAA